MPRVTGTSVLLIGLAGSALAQEAPSGGICSKPDTVAFRGNARVTEAALRSDVGISPGSTLSVRTLQRAIKDLFATQQFDDVNVECRVTEGRVMLVITVAERPLLGDVDVRGPSRVQPGTVRDQVDILIGRPVDPAQIAKVVARIDSLYEAKGYYLADVRAETTHVEAGTKITFAVDEGRRLAVSGVRISGNKAINAKTLVGAMETQPEGFLWYKKGEFDDDKYAADLTEKLPGEYAKHGFIDMQLSRDSLIVDRGRGKAMVDLTVDEGLQYVVGDFEVTGARRFNDTEIKRFYPFADRSRTLKETLADATKVFRRGVPKDPSNVFDQSRWQSATQLVRDAYANEGYIHARLQPVLERTRVGGDSTPTVNLRWDIDEGSPAIVNRVDIVGNDITTESCIRDQILVVPGDVFNSELLKRSYQSLSQMQFFESPLPGPETKLDEKGDIDIIFNVKEKKTGNVNFGASVGQGTGVGGFIGFDQPNLFGLCKRGSLQWQYGKYVNDFNLSYTDPRIRESRVSGTITAYHTQSRFIIGNLGRQTRAGGQVRFGFLLPRSRWTRLFLEYGGESVKYGEGAVTSFINCGAGRSCFRSNVGATIDRDTRIDMPFPSQGAHHSISAQFNGGPLGGTAAFQRFTGELRGYTTIAQFGGRAVGSQPLKLVTGITTKLGAVFGDPGPFFVYQSFALGGVQYGEQLRGYEEFSISPNGYLGETGQTQAQTQSFGTTFFTSSAELGLRVSQQLYLSSFVDVGNLWLRPRDFNPTRLFRGAGVGAALVTPLGPLGLDIAYGFDRKNAAGVNAGKWLVHFKFGQFF
jgi:outer membrane protein insertion porin family